MSKIQELRSIIDNYLDEGLAEKKLLLSIIDDIHLDLEKIERELTLCCGTCANKPFLIQNLSNILPKNEGKSTND